MGLGPAPKSVKKKTHRSFFGGIEHGLGVAAHETAHAVSGTSRGLYHGVTGLPTGAYMAGRAFGHDFLHPNFAHPGREHLVKLGKAVGTSEIDAYRHFGRGGDFSAPLLDLLAALSGGGALVGKGLAASRALKAGEGLTEASRALLESHPHYRQIPGTPYSIPASPNPLIRAGQKAVLKNKRVAARAVKRREWQAERFQRQLAGAEKSTPYSGPVELPPGVKVSTEEIRTKADRKKGFAKSAIDMPMNALRLSMWLRPRYYVQNLTQTGAMLGSRPVASSRAIEQLVQIARRNPQLYKDLQNIAGEGQALALNEGTLNPSKFMEKAGYLANRPEAHFRTISSLTQMRRAGYKTEKQLENAMAQLKSGKPSSRALNAAITANEDVGDFGRLSKRERQFMKTQIPIFYPMFKALTRYGYRLPSEHAIQSAAGLSLGKAGKAEQNRLLGDLPFWAQYLIPKGAGDPNAKPGPRQAVFNPGNIYNLQPAADLTRQVVAPTRRYGPIPGLSLLQELGPTAPMIFGAITGHDIQTGYPLRLMSKKGIKHNFTKTSIEASIRDFVENLPGSDVARLAIGGKPPLKSYVPDDALHTWLQQVVGPAFLSRTLRTQQTQKQAKGEKQYGHGRRKKHKAPNF